MLKEIKYGGFTANPNDHDSVEGDLAVAMNLVPEDGTVKPVLPPSDVFTVPSGSTIMCIHKTAAYTHYILWNEDAHTLSYMDKQGDTYTATTITLDITLSGVVKVEPIGNTLVILADDGIHYILWKPDAEGGSKYAYLGQKPPEVNITFGLDSKFEAMPGFADDGMPAEQIHIRRGDIPIKNLQMPYYDGNSGAVPPKSEAQADENFTAFDFSLEGKVGDDGTTTIDAEVSHITEHALAAVNKFIATLGTQKERFVSPFFVRYALELYDGSIYMHSCPILMIPNSRGPVFALNPNAYDWDEWESGLILRYHSGDKIEYAFNGRVIGFTSSLYYELHSESLKNWEDIIRGVGIYVSAPIYTYDQAGKVYGWEDMSDDGDWDSYYTLGRIKAEDTAMDDEPSLSGWLQDEWKRWGLIDVCRFDSKKMSQGQPTQYLFGRNSNYPNDKHEPACILRIPEFSKDNIDRRIAEECNFYKIYTIDIEDLFADHTSTPLKSGIKLEKGILDSLVTRERLTDDYQTRDLLYADMSSVYNARINLAGIKRKLHKPIGVQFQWTKCELQGQDLGSSIAVGVRSDGKLRVVNRERTLNALMQTGQPGPLYFFYSDSNATKAYIKWGDSVYILPLRPHSTLNGAFWMGDIWCGSDWRIGLESYIGEIPTEESTIITVENKIYTSEVNNPFFFPASGISTIGAGRILGLSAAVKALSQGQFGQFPLYAFTTDGVWALETNSTGGYSSAKPVSRDVCLNADSITQLDDAVLFATARGIMLISGSQAQCISDAINDGDVPPENGMQTVMDAFTQLGRSYPNIAPFRDFLGGEDASLRMLYDYRHQRIIAYNPSYSYAYIYSLESHKWGMMESDIQYTINSYPDALAVTGDNVLVNYSDSPVGDGSAIVIPALLVTRPLTLDMPDVHKTVRRVLQRGMFRRWQGGEHMTALLYGSRDLYDWHLIYASNGERMQGFSGTPYKWFRVALVLNVEGNESITGATVEMIDKYTGKPR